MKRMDAFPEPPIRDGQKYPWTKLLDGNVYEVSPMREFGVTPKSFEQTFRAQVWRLNQKHDLGLSGTVRHVGGKVYVQATTRPTPVDIDAPPTIIT